MGNGLCVQMFFEYVFGWSVGDVVDFTYRKYRPNLAIGFYSINNGRIHFAVFDRTGPGCDFPVVKVVVRARCRRDGEFVVVVNFAMYSDFL